MTPSLAINYTDGFTPACLHSHNANRNVLLFCFTNKTGSCTKTMTVSQILTEMQLCKLWGWRICDCEEMQPYRTPLHLGNAHRGQTWHSLAYSSGALLWCASQRTIFTQKYIKVSRFKRRQIPLWVRFPDSANCFQLPPSLTPVLSWPLRKHAVDYHRIGNPPEEFPANCILLDKGNGLRKFGLGRKTRLEEQSELSDALSSRRAPPLLNGDHGKFRMGLLPLFSRGWSTQSTRATQLQEAGQFVQMPLNQFKLVWTNVFFRIHLPQRKKLSYQLLASACLTVATARWEHPLSTLVEMSWRA